MPEPTPTAPDPFLNARALVLRDLRAYHLDTGRVVSLLDEVLEHRRWWVQQWPDGAVFLPCLIAQDVQEALAEAVGEWPLCRYCADPTATTRGRHPLRITPDLGEDPHWVCEESGTLVAAVGSLTDR